VSATGGKPTFAPPINLRAIQEEIDRDFQNEMPPQQALRSPQPQPFIQQTIGLDLRRNTRIASLDP
jgi:hypothetical protein